MDPGRYGCVLARTVDNGLTVDLLEVQPVQDYVGLREALEVGFPFWSREATYWTSDLMTDPRFESAYKSSEVRPESCVVERACAALSYGVDVEESTFGWARDVFPAKAYYWCRPNKRPVSGAYFAGEDAEFRREQKASQR